MILHTHTDDIPRTISTQFAADAHAALVQTAREARITVSTLMRRGAVLAIHERGQNIPQSLACLATDIQPEPDPINQMISLATADLTFGDLTRLVQAFVAWTKFDMAQARRLAGYIATGAVDYDYREAITSQLVRQGSVAVDVHPAGPFESEPRDLTPDVAQPTNDCPATPPWHEP
jgi:hypothetical protein